MTIVERIAALPTASRAASWLTMAVFALLVLTPAAIQLSGIGRMATSENRVLAPAPTIAGPADLLALPRKLEAFVNDRFGLRQQMILAYNGLRFRLGFSGVKDVVIGKDQWLFYTADRLMEQHMGVDVFTPEGLEHWVSTMERVHDWLEKQGIAFYILIAPDKNTAYPEMMPSHLTRPSGRTTRLDQLTERMKTSRVALIDPRPALAEAKARGAQTYFAGDSHWTERGAFIAYSQLMERMRNRFPALQPLLDKDYAPSRGKPMAADLARLLSLEDTLVYDVERLKLREVSRRTQNPKTTTRPGWGWRVEEFTNGLKDAPRLLVYGDSFTTYVLGPDMLYATFRDPVWTHNSGGTLNLRLATEFKPDVVVLQMADRYLWHTPLPPLGME